MTLKGRAHSAWAGAKAAGPEAALRVVEETKQDLTLKGRAHSAWAGAKAAGPEPALHVVEGMSRT